MVDFTAHIYPSDYKPSPRRAKLLDRSLPISEQFESYHRENPGVYRALVETAYKWYRDPKKPSKVGMDHLVSGLRWNDPDIAPHYSHDGFKIDQRFCAYYSRLIMKSEPPLRGLFDTKTAKDPDAWIEQRQPEERIDG